MIILERILLDCFKPVSCPSQKMFAPQIIKKQHASIYLKVCCALCLQILPLDGYLLENEQKFGAFGMMNKAFSFKQKANMNKYYDKKPFDCSKYDRKIRIIKITSDT